MSISTLSRALALTLVVGATATVSLTPAHATDGDTAARRCIDDDACHISPSNADGSFTLVFDGGGVIWCPGLDGECVVVSPDTGKGTGNPRGPVVAAPISTTQPVKAPGPVVGTPIAGKPTGGKPVGVLPVGVNPITVTKPIGVLPVGVNPITVTKPIGLKPGNPKAPIILLARRSH